MAKKQDNTIRDERGRFEPGTGGGPGRPSKSKEIDYWRVCKTQVTLEDWAAIIDRAVADARKGSATARAWLSKLMVGDVDKLRKRLDVDDTDALSIETTADVIKVLGDELAEIATLDTDVRRSAAIGILTDKILKAIEIDVLAGKIDAMETLLDAEGGGEK